MGTVEFRVICDGFVLSHWFGNSVQVVVNWPVIRFEFVSTKKFYVRLRLNGPIINLNSHYCNNIFNCRR